ncbi:hypothetical protein [Natrialba aegyptia]|uniref:hypothetical protein n=1 Tax=Natrialba aegyptia TaxID=129789 RepID=UPI00403B3878
MEIEYYRAPWPLTRHADHSVQIHSELAGINPEVHTTYDPRRRHEIPRVVVHRNAWEDLVFEGRDEIINSMHRLTEEDATYQYVGTEWRTDGENGHRHQYLLIDVDTDERGVTRETIPISNLKLDASLSAPDLEFHQATRRPNIEEPLDAAFVTAHYGTLNAYFPIDSDSYVRLFWNINNENKHWRIEQADSIRTLESEMVNTYKERVIWRCSD